jgi:molecular chaperone GrpE
VTGQVRVPPAGDAGEASEQPAGGGVHLEEGGPSPAGVPSSAVELDALQAQLEERTGDLQRISAEYSNYRRRVERDRQLVISMAKAQLATQLLTVLDDIERAHEHGDLSGVFKAVADKLVAALQAQGLEPFGAVGDGFDPDMHEAVHHSTSPDVDTPTVTAVLRRGYRFGERVLRPAMVAVTDDAGEAAPSGDAQPTGDAEPSDGPLDGREALQDN